MCVCFFFLFNRTQASVRRDGCCAVEHIVSAFEYIAFIYCLLVNSQFKYAHCERNTKQFDELEGARVHCVFVTTTDSIAMISLSATQSGDSLSDPQWQCTRLRPCVQHVWFGWRINEYKRIANGKRFAVITQT